MRILVSCLQSEVRHPGPAYLFWRDYFIRGLQEAGHETLEVPGVDWALGMVLIGEELESWRARTWQKTLDFVGTELTSRRIDLFLSYLFPKQVDVSAIREIQRRGIPCCNHFCDNLREFWSVPKEFECFSLNWVPDAGALGMYRASKVPHIHAPMPCWVAPEYRNVPEVESEPPTFIGTIDLLRRELLGKALHAGANISIRGVGWVPSPDDTETTVERSKTGTMLVNQLAFLRDYGVRSFAVKVLNRLLPVPQPHISPAAVGPVLSASDFIRVIREARVFIGINRTLSHKTLDRRPLFFSRLRDIEAPMLGACYLTEWSEELDSMYEDGKDIEVYRTPDELKQKLDELEAHPVRRRELRQNGQRRALNELTVSRTIERIAQRLGL